MDFLRFLPADIVLNHIINCLDFTTRIRAAGVSHAWKVLLEAAPYTPDLPWLWFGPGKVDYDYAPIHKSFLIDLISSTTTPACNHPAPFVSFSGSHGPYLTFSLPIISWKPTQRFFYSPFTGENFELPTTYLDQHRARGSMGHHIYPQFFSRAAGSLVAALENESNALYLFRPGDDNWVQWLKPHYPIRDIIFHKGELYCIEGTDIIAYDIMHDFSFENNRHNSSKPGQGSEGRSRLLTQPHGRKIATDKEVLKSSYPGSFCRIYLVEFGQELFVVVKANLHWRRKPVFTVHRIDEEDGKLVQVEDLGGRMLFVEDGSSVMSGFGPGQTMPSDSFFTKNCIYFFDIKPWCDQIFADPKQKYRIGKFKLDSKTCHYHPQYGFENEPLWLVPDTLDK